MKDFRVSLVCCLLMSLGLIVATPHAGAQIQVTSATPSSTAQGTINLDVVIKGSGFKKGVKAQWFVTGTTNPGGVTVNSTTFNNSGQLTANITVSDTAVIANFDVQIANADGRTGKGTELFAITQKGNNTSSCTPLMTIGAAGNACPGPGCLDATFGGGVVITDVNPGSNLGQAATQLAIQSDGRVLAAGGTKPPVVVRYLTDGTLDHSFGIGGVSRLDTRVTSINAIELQPDGKIVLAGRVGANPSSLVIARLLDTGAHDPSFGVNGVFSYSTATRKNTPGIEANAVAVQRDGRIVASGFQDARWVAVRVNSDGTFDTGFGVNGRVTIDFGLNDIQYARDMLLQDVALPLGGTEQRIVIAGDVKSTNSSRDWAIVRLLPNGQQDASFGSRGDGTTTLDFCSIDETPVEMEMDSMGRIWMVGGSKGWAVARFTPKGLLDDSFGAPNPDTGLQTGKLRFAANAGLDSVAVDNAGNAVLIGSYVPTQGPAQVATIRLRPDGTLDSNYSTGIALLSPDYAFIGAAFQADGRLVVSGWKWVDPSLFAVARLLQ